MDENKTAHNYEDGFIADFQDYKYKEMLEKADNVVLGFVAATGGNRSHSNPVC
ncbi:hypothetical protein [Anaerocolumna sp.]|uniref:hypothetical protein n=1 Tax=Anaerocolumna sp. TaxID=2041569 RepID=UPI0028A74964|nr:hypothetical protein [Anaerocolumna sp.]